MTNVRGGSTSESAAGLAWRALFLEWLGTLACLLLGLAWLHIADSHVWQFAFSVISGVLLVIAFCWIQILVFRDLRRPSVLAPIWQRLLVFLLLAGFWLVLLSWIGTGRGHAPLYAGYWNSKLSPGLRYFATYERLAQWQQYFWSLVEWLLTALLLPIAVEGGTAGISALAWRRIGHVYRHWRYWLAAIVCGFAGSALVAGLVAWMPGSGVAQQVASVLFRIGIAYTAVILLWTFMVSLSGSYLQREEKESDSETDC